MAELVQTFLENMIPEMEEMEQLGIFTRKEVSRILKRRRAFEYKLRRLGKTLSDYTEYIEYEQNVLSLLLIRRKKLGCKLKKQQIEIPIVRRIHRLYGQATKRFPRDIQAWLSHIAFAKLRKEKGSISRIISKMLRCHNHQPELWIFVAKYEFEDNNDTDTARKFFLRGLQFNFNSQILWLEYYRMELLVCQKSRMRMEILSGSVDKFKQNSLDCSIALVIIKKALEAISDDVGFFLKFLPICRLFDFTDKHEDAFFELLIENFSNHELTWDAIARRKLLEAQKTREDDSKLFPIHFKVCLETFDEAVKHLPTQTMYALYLKFCLEQLTEKVNHKKTKSNLVTWCLQVFETANEKDILTADMFTMWNDVLSNVGYISKAIDVLKCATKKYPLNVDLWCLLLNYHCLGGQENSDKAMKTFENALKVVKIKDSWPLWEMVWNYCTSFSMEKEIEKLCERGLPHPEPNISSQMRTRYLLWLYLAHGIESAREHYKKFHWMKPLARIFFEEYINMELAQSPVNMDNIRSAYNDALGVYGEDNADLWINYMKLEMKHPGGKLDQLPIIYFKASKTLDESSLAEFNHKYTLFRAGLTE